MARQLLEYLQGLAFIDSFLAEGLPGITMVRPGGTYVPLLDCRSWGGRGELERILVEKGRWPSAAVTGSVPAEVRRISIAAPGALIHEGHGARRLAFRDLLPGM